MSGYFAMGSADPAEGAQLGQRAGTTLIMHAQVGIDDLARLIIHPARSLTGSIDFAPLERVSRPARAGGMLNVQEVPDNQWPLMKEAAERSGYGERFRKMPLAINFDPEFSYGRDDPCNDRHSVKVTYRYGVGLELEQSTCVHCGNCDIGCQVGARNTLDLNYIPHAERYGGVVKLPEQMFYNTGIGTYVWIVTNRKEKRRKGKIQSVDARDVWTAGGSQDNKRSLGDKRRHITNAQIAEIVKLYGRQADGGTSKTFDNADFGYTRVTVEQPLRLRYQMTPEDKARFLDALPHLLDDVQAIDKALSVASRRATGTPCTARRRGWMR